MANVACFLLEADCAEPKFEDYNIFLFLSWANEPWILIGVHSLDLGGRIGLLNQMTVSSLFDRPTEV